MKKILPIIIAVVITAVASSGITYYVTVEMLDKPSDKNESSYSEDVNGGSSNLGYALEVIDESVVGSSSQNKFEIKSAVVDKDDSGKDVVLVTYVYTRLSGEPETFTQATDPFFYRSVYQNGTSLSHINDDDELEKTHNFDSKTRDNDVKAGYSIEHTHIYELKDKKADLVVEIEEDHYEGEGSYIVSKTFKMK